MVKVCDMTEEEHARVLEYKRQWREKNKDKISGYQKKYHSTHKDRYRRYYEDNKEKFFERARKSRAKYPDEKRARSIINCMIARGKLVKEPCEVCGNPKADAHHDDYNKPLDVRWLCREHHAEWHSKNEPIRATHKRNCCECGQEFVYIHNRQKYCSDKCKKEANKKLCHEYYLTHKEKWK